MSTPDPAAWHHLGQAATGRTDRVAAIQPGAASQLGASSDAPVPSVDETGTGSATSDGARHTHLAVLPALTPTNSAMVRNADIVVLQRLMREEAATAMSELRFSSWQADTLLRPHDEMLTV